MSILDQLLNPQQPSEMQQIQSLLQGGGPNALNYTPVPPSNSPVVSPQTAPLSRNRAPQQEQTIAALDYDGPQAVPQAQTAPMGEVPAAPATPQTPSTIDEFLSSQMASLGNTSELEKKSLAEEKNSEEILAQLNANSGATPFATELLTAIAALAPAFINKGSGADAALKSYDLGRKQLKDDEAVKRNLLTDRFKISQGKIDRYDTKAASINQQKTGLMGTLFNAKENREARAEESKQRSMDRQLTREANALQRDMMNADRDARRAADERDRAFRRDMMAKELNLREKDHELKVSAEDRRERGQQLNRLQKESETSLGGVLARIPGKEVSPKDAEFAKNKMQEAQSFFSKLDELNEVYSKGTLGGKPVDNRDMRVASLTADIVQSTSRLRGMGANWTENEREVTELMAALRSGSYQVRNAVLQKLTGLTEQEDALGHFIRRTKGAVHDGLANRGIFWPGRYNEVMPETLESLRLNTPDPKDYYTLVSAMKYGVVNNPDAKEFDSQYANFPSPGSVVQKSQAPAEISDPPIGKFYSAAENQHYIKYKSGRYEKVDK